MADTNITLQTLIGESMSRAKDPDITQWTTAQLVIFAKKAHSYIQRILIRENSEIVMSTGSIAMTATQEFLLSGNLDNFWKIASVFFAGQLPMTSISVEDAKREGTTTTDVDPKNFYLTATAIGMVNIPSATSIAAFPTLTCRYFAMETHLTLTASMPYKNLFNEPISAFMDHMAIMKKDDPTAEYTALYNALEEATLSIVREREGL